LNCGCCSKVLKKPTVVGVVVVVVVVVVKILHKIQNIHVERIESNIKNETEYE